MWVGGKGNKGTTHIIAGEKIAAAAERRKRLQKGDYLADAEKKREKVLISPGIPNTCVTPK